MANTLVWETVKTAQVSKEGARFDLCLTKDGKYGLSFVPYHFGEYNVEDLGDFNSEQEAMLFAHKYLINISQ